MTDKKVSELDEVGSVVSTDSLYIVSNGLSKKASVQKVWDYTRTGFTYIGEDDVAYATNITLTDHVVFTGGGKLVPAAGVTVTLAGGYTAHDYQHVFDITNGSVKGTKANYVTPFHFGATAEGVTGDDTAAIQAAIEYATLAQIRDEYATGHRVVLPPTPSTDFNDFYHVTSDIIVNRNIIIEGNAPAGRTLGAVRIKFSDACDAGFWFAHPGGISTTEPYTSEVGSDFWGSGRSIMRNMTLEPVNAGMVDFGIIHNSVIVLEDIACQEFRLANFFAHGQTSGNSAYGVPIDTGAASGTMRGNTDGSIYRRCFARLATEGYGFAALGNDTQIMTYDTCDANGNNGAGFLDNSSIGNSFINCHTAQNTWKVLHGGVYYMPIKGHTAATTNEPGTGVDWETYWTVVTATTHDDNAWAVDKVYRACGGINIVDEQSFAVILSHYTEGGIELGIIPRGETTILGGVASGTGRILRHPEFAGTRVIGSSIGETPGRWKHTNDAGETYGGSTGSSQFYETPTFLEFGHSNDSSQNVTAWKFRWNDVRNQYEYTYEGGNGVFGFTGTDFSQDGYSGAGNVICPNGLLLGDASGSTPRYARIRSVQNNGAISGVVVVGDIWYYTEPVAGGKVGAVCTTAGTVGSTAVIKEFGVIDT